MKLLTLMIAMAGLAAAQTQTYPISGWCTNLTECTLHSAEPTGTGYLAWFVDQSHNSVRFFIWNGAAVVDTGYVSPAGMTVNQTAPEAATITFTGVEANLKCSGYPTRYGLRWFCQGVVTP